MTVRIGGRERAVQRTVTLPVGDVASMECARRLSRDRTIRSSCYSDLLASQTPVDRARVGVMEALLYERAPRVDACQPGQHLPLPHSRFDCGEGTIWFHYSPKLRMFVLATFRLHRRDGSSGSGDDASTSEGRGWCRSFGHGEGVAARLHVLVAATAAGLRRPDAGGRDLPPGAPRVERPRFADWIVGHGAFLAFGAAVHQATLEIARSCDSIRDPGCALALPSWSHLALASRVREQVENPYARLIFAGEALCRMGEAFGLSTGALGLAPFRCPDGRRRASAPAATPVAAVLLAESVAILDVVRDGDPARLWHRSRSCYLTASLMDGDMLADGDRLGLIRSEMTFRLAMAVASSAASEPHRARGPAVERDILRRFALLGDFVRKSGAYFDDVHVRVVDDRAPPSTWPCGAGGPTVAGDLVRALHGFGRSASLIVDELAPEDPREATGDLGATHGRLLAIATEILG